MTIWQEQFGQSGGFGNFLTTDPLQPLRLGRVMSVISLLILSFFCHARPQFRFVRVERAPL
jgi:hypothetical protein